MWAPSQLVKTFTLLFLIFSFVCYSGAQSNTPTSNKNVKDSPLTLSIQLLNNFLSSGPKKNANDLKLSISPTLKLQKDETSNIFNRINSDDFFSTTDPFQDFRKQSFLGIKLNHDVPDTFVQDQIFSFNGAVVQESYLGSLSNVRIVTVLFTSFDSFQQFSCQTELEPNVLEFSISCKMRKVGVYYLSIYAGFGPFQSSFKTREIVSRPKRNLGANKFLDGKHSQKPENVTLILAKNNLYINWSSVAPLTKLSIYQRNAKEISRKIEFYLSNYHKKFKIPFKDFVDFQPITTYIEVSHGSSDDGTQYLISSAYSQIEKISFQAIEHAFSEKRNEIFKVDPPLPYQMKLREGIKFTFNFQVQINKNYYIIYPNKEVIDIPLTVEGDKLTGQYIPPNTAVNCVLFFDKPGTHIIQINDATGLAIINQPIYVGDSYPLIPDFVDLMPRKYVEQKIKQNTTNQLQDYIRRRTNNKTLTEPRFHFSQMNEKQQYLLYLLNNLRSKAGVPSVVLDQQLNALAQLHADDMSKNNYSGHVNLQGQGPQQRATKMNITYQVAQNLAKSNSLTQGHLGLERSASHYKNKIYKEWQRVGIGLSRTGPQYLIVYEFSGRDLAKKPLSSAERASNYQKLIEFVKKSNPNIKKQNKELSKSIDQWLDSDRKVQIFQYLKQKVKIRGRVASSSFTVSYENSWISILKQNGYMQGYSQYSEIGAGIKQKGSGMIQGLVIFL